MSKLGHVFSDHIEFEIDGISDLGSSEIRPILCERYERNREKSISYFNHCETHTIESDASFFDEEIIIFWIEIYAINERTIILFFESGDGSSGIDMTCDKVSIKSFTYLYASFHIECVIHFLRSEVGHSKCLFHREEFIVIVLDFRERHTSTVMCDTLSFFERISESVFHPKKSIFFIEDFGLMFDNS